MLWAPDVAVMYPGGHSTHIEVAELGADYCGAARPGHFDGVATIVAKLFNQVRPMSRSLAKKIGSSSRSSAAWRATSISARYFGAPIARDPDGLALSSRNAYLSAEERSAAVAFPKALKSAAAALASSGDMYETLAKAEAAIVGGGFDSVDYIALADADSLERLDSFRTPARLLAPRGSVKRD